MIWQIVFRLPPHCLNTLGCHASFVQYFVLLTYAHPSCFYLENHIYSFKVKQAKLIYISSVHVTHQQLADMPTELLFTESKTCFLHFEAPFLSVFSIYVIFRLELYQFRSSVPRKFVTFTTLPSTSPHFLFRFAYAVQERDLHMPGHRNTFSERPVSFLLPNRHRQA